MKNYNTERRDWNDNQGFLERLDRRFDESNQAANEGFLITWYRHLRTIYRIMNHKISADQEIRRKTPNDEKTEEVVNIVLAHLFDKAKDEIKAIHGDHGNKIITQQIQTMSMTDAEETLDRIDTILSDLYVKYFIRLELDQKDPKEAIKEVFDQ